MTQLSLRFAMMLLSVCCGQTDREAIVGDICEMYMTSAAKRGTANACCRLWREVFLSAPRLVARRCLRAGARHNVIDLALGVFLGCATIIAVQAVTGAIGRALYLDTAAFMWPRLADSFVALAAGGFVTARTAQRCVDKGTIALACCTLGLSLWFLIPVLPSVYTAGTLTILYHVVILLIVAPSIAAGARLSAAAGSA